MSGERQLLAGFRSFFEATAGCPHQAARIKMDQSGPKWTKMDQNSVSRTPDSMARSVHTKFEASFKKREKP